MQSMNTGKLEKLEKQLTGDAVNTIEVYFSIGDGKSKNAATGEIVPTASLTNAIKVRPPKKQNIIEKI